MLNIRDEQSFQEARTLFSIAISSGAILADPTASFKKLINIYPDWDPLIANLWEICTLKQNYLSKLSPLFENKQESLKVISEYVLLLIPHTHWKTPGPVLIDWTDSSKSTLKLGHLNPTASTCYLPVSFVICDNQLLPYEWANELLIDLSIYRSFLELATQIASIRNTKETGFGLGFNYRSILSSNSYSFAIEADHNSSFSIIYEGETMSKDIVLKISLYPL
jgi:hypothetical protein